MEIRYGITGNYYVISTDKEEVITMALLLNRAIKSVYWNKKYGKWVLRIKRKSDKLLLKSFLSK